MAKPLVSIIILTYGKGWQHLDKCLNSLFEINYKNIEIVIVDNASSDDTVAKVSGLNYEKIKLIKNGRNTGFASGNNQGVEIASGKYILFLNNDTAVSPDFLNILVENLEKDKSVGVVQPKIRQMVDREKLDACASFLTNTGFLYHFGYSQNQSEKKYNKKMEMYSVKGACFLTRKGLIEKIGLFDDDYFAYFEETDFCHRTWLSGFKVLYDQNSEIFHLGGPDKEVSSKIMFYSYKNRIQTYMKNFEMNNVLTIIPVHIAICFLIASAYLLKGKPGYSLAILKAIGWNFINIKKVLEKRNIVNKKIRRVSDSEILPKISKKVNLNYYKHFFFDPRGFYDFKEI